MAELASSLATDESGRLNQAEELVRSFCRWHIGPLRRGVTFTLDGSGTCELLLPTLQLAAVTSIVEDGVAVDLTTVKWYANGVVWRDTPWTYSRQGVVITADHGYSIPPSDVEAVVQAVAQRATDNPGSQTRVQRGPFADGNSYTALNESAALALLESEKRVLRAYRIPVA